MPGADPIAGCYRWFNGGWVLLWPDKEASGGPFKAKWEVVNAAQHAYTLTWQQPGITTVTISANQRQLSGGNQYGGKDTATRIAGTSGLVGTWQWFDLIASKVTVKPDGTFSAASSRAMWHGTWQAIQNAPGTYKLTASDLPKDTVTLASDGMHISGADQYGLEISGVKTQSCNID